MKKTLLTTLLLAAVTVTAFGQGQIGFVNNVTGQFRARIYAADPTDSTVALSGNTADSGENPLGTQVYAGGRLDDGAGAYTAALYGGPLGTAAGDMMLLGTTTIRSGGAAGLFNTVPLITVAGVNAGSAISFEIRVWDNQGGTINDWASVLGNDNILRGSSGVVDSSPLGGGTVTPPNTIGWESFNVHTIGGDIPEPSILVLGALGLGALVLRRRKTS
jgi:hypothetical protein